MWIGNRALEIGRNSTLVAMKSYCRALSAVALLFVCASLYALDRQPTADYHARRVALAQKLEGGAAILFAAEEPLLDFMPYRQDEDFYYLTGWNEPGAALVILADHPTPQDPSLPYNLWTQPGAPQSQPVINWIATPLGNGAPPATHDITTL